MSLRARTPSYDGYGGGPNGNAPLTSGKALDTSPLAAASQRPVSQAYSYMPGDDLSDTGPTVQQLEGAGLHRTASSSSKAGGATVSRSNTLTKKTSISRKSSLKRSGSRRSLAAGSLKGVQIDDPKRAVGDEYNSAFYCPVPTTGSPTEILANRFQAWRKFLKDLIAYFKEVQTSYEHRSKALLKVANVINNTTAPSIFLAQGGLNEATKILRDYHRQAVSEANKARDIEEDVITQLAGLRADLGQKIKEIKSLSGDFKNSVDKEKDHTRRAVNGLSEALAIVDRDASALVGKEDPYIIKLSVDRQIERQIDEENYLHRAYLNLEGSGRELESIVVGEVQKAYNALAGILKREADESYNAVDALRNGPVTIPKDLEWTNFIDSDSHFISADTPLRKVEDIEYPGKLHPAAAEVRAGMLERKSKYLKSYTPGWYVLSPTHLHEFKSADHIYSQSPIMSLLLSAQKLGSHSQPGSSSHKFMLKGSQTGSMHRGHSWVFRAETYDTMLAWYDDIRNLTEKTGEERNAFVRKHARSFSAGSHKASSVSGDSELGEDEADEVPFSAAASVQNKDMDGAAYAEQARRPEPGGRFPSDMNVQRRGLRGSTSSSSSQAQERAQQPQSGQPLQQDLSTMAGGLGPQSTTHDYTAVPVVAAAAPVVGAETVRREDRDPYARDDPAAYQQQLPPMIASQPPPPVATQYAGPETMINNTMPPAQASALPPSQDPFLGGSSAPAHNTLARHDSNYHDWMAPAGAGVGGAAVGAAGALGAEHYWRKKKEEAEVRNAASPGANAVSGIDMADHANSPTASAGVLPLPPTSSHGPADPAPNSPVEPILAPPVVMGSLNAPAAASTATGPPSVLSDSTAATELTDSPVTSKFGLVDGVATGPGVGHTAYDTNPDGTVNAKQTGRVWPILRHNTDVSVSNLHVPGEFPRGSGS